jgi:hypothetical protein
METIALILAIPGLILSVAAVAIALAGRRQR